MSAGLRSSPGPPRRAGVPIDAMVVLLVSRTEFTDWASAANLRLDRRPALGNPQAFERGPNLLLALLVQDRLVFEPQHERVKPRN